MAGQREIRAGGAFVELYVKDKSGGGLDAFKKGLEDFWKGEGRSNVLALHAAMKITETVIGTCSIALAALKGDWDAFSKGLDRLPLGMGAAIKEAYQFARDVSAVIHNLMNGKSMGFDPTAATQEANAAQDRVEKLQAITAEMQKQMQMEMATPGEKKRLKVEADYQKRMDEIRAHAAEDAWTKDNVKKAEAVAGAERTERLNQPAREIVVAEERAAALVGKSRSEAIAFDLKDTGASASSIKEAVLAAEKHDLTQFAHDLEEQQKTAFDRQVEETSKLIDAKNREIITPDKLHQLLNGLLMAGPARGIFGSAAIQSLQGGGGGPAERTAKAAEATQKNTAVIAEATRRGGDKFT